MDPVLIVLLVGVGALVGPPLVKVGIANAITKYSKKKSDNLTHKKLAKEYKEKQKAAKYREKMIQKGIDPSINIKYDMDRFHNLMFKNVKTGFKQAIRVREDASFNESEDVLLKGRLHIVDANNARTVQDIYLFQPRVFSSKCLLGPKLDKNGNLSDRYTYLCKTADNNLLTGYVPKREVLSGMRFDFIRDDEHKFIERNPNFSDFDSDELYQAEALEKFIYVDIPRDEKGQYQTVNLNNPQEREAFERYKRNNQNPRQWFSEQLNKAKGGFYKYLNEHRPDYAVAYDTGTVRNENNQSDGLKVQESKKPKASINDYYKRYDYYLDPHFGERYNDYDGEYGHRNGHRHR